MFGGPLELEPNAAELALLLPWCLGGNATGTPAVNYALAETLQTRYVTIDRVSKVFTYAGCAINSARFSAMQGEPLKLSLDVVGQTETVAAAGSFPAVTESLATQPFILSDLVMTIGGTAVAMKKLDVTVNNHIDKNRFFNTNTLSGILANDRETTFETEIPYDTAYTAIYGSGASGVAVVATFTNGAVSMVMTMAAVSFPRRTPPVPNRAEIMLTIRGEAEMTSTTKELSIVLDSTP